MKAVLAACLFLISASAFAQETSLETQTRAAQATTQEAMQPLNSREKRAIQGGMADMMKGFTGFMGALSAARKQANADMAKQDAAAPVDNPAPATPKKK